MGDLGRRPLGCAAAGTVSMIRHKNLELEMSRVAEALRTAIRLSGVSIRSIERSLGLSTGYVTRLLEGAVALRLWHVFGILQSIGLPPGDFFSALYRSEDHAIGRALRQLHPSVAGDDPDSVRAIVSRLRHEMEELETALAARKPEPEHQEPSVESGDR